jgi:hypothetical protein
MAELVEGQHVVMVGVKPVGKQTAHHDIPVREHTSCERGAKVLQGKGTTVPRVTLSKPSHALYKSALQGLVFKEQTANPTVQGIRIVSGRGPLNIDGQLVTVNDTIAIAANTAIRTQRHQHGHSASSTKPNHNHNHNSSISISNSNSSKQQQQQTATAANSNSSKQQQQQTATAANSNSSKQQQRQQQQITH